MQGDEFRPAPARRDGGGRGRAGDDQGAPLSGHGDGSSDRPASQAPRSSGALSAGKIAFELAAAGQTQLVLQVDEKNLGLLRLEQGAAAVADAYPGQRFPARISYIAPGVDAQRGTVEVKLVVPAPPEFLRPDMTVSVEIDAGRAPNAITLPSELLREATSSAPWVVLPALLVGVVGVVGLRRKWR